MGKIVVNSLWVEILRIGRAQPAAIFKAFGRVASSNVRAQLFQPGRPVGQFFQEGFSHHCL